MGNLQVSQDAIDLIVTEEDSSQGYYTKHYEHFDWPQGASGPTIGIGYDCGYVTPTEARGDWEGIVDESTITAIVHACGLRSESAHAFVQAYSGSVTISWEEAMKEFSDREIPKWLSRLQAHLPNCEKLSPDSRGALLSLAYNRGTSFDDPGARYAEMRAIKSDMIVSNFADIPGQFLAMRRLWPVGGDLWLRRGHEALLFKRGLGRNLIWAQHALNLLGCGPIDEDDQSGPQTVRVLRAYQAAKGLTVTGTPNDETYGSLEAGLAAIQPKS